jgi:GNAT superfamily N-acetyltransferase
MRPGATLTIREASPADAGDIARLLLQLGYPTPPETVAGRLASLARRGDTRILVAEAGAGAVGFLSLTRMEILPYAAPLARITALCVDESSRCAGIGGALEGAAAEIARGWSCEKLEVTSNRRRVRAHGFYGRLGYEETHRFFVKRLRSAEPEAEDHGAR